MTRYLIRWIVTALTVLAVPHLISGIYVDSLGTALALALVLALLNVLLKPLLVLVTLPFTLLSFGLFLFVINGIVFWISAQWVSGVRVESFGAAFLASLVVSIVSGMLSLTLKREEGKVRWVFEKSRSKNDDSYETIELEKDQGGKWRQV
jgi:putative membrane protein